MIVWNNRERCQASDGRQICILWLVLYGGNGYTPFVLSLPKLERKSPNRKAYLDLDEPAEGFV